MNVLVCGSRTWTDRERMKSVLEKLREEFEGEIHLIVGGARGADERACLLAEELGYTYENYYAQWDRYGRSAGPIRNKKMVDILVEEGGKLVLAFFGPGPCKGTWNTVKYARTKELTVRGFPQEGISVGFSTEEDHDGKGSREVSTSVEGK